jgi:hypothetical protein
MQGVKRHRTNPVVGAIWQPGDDSRETSPWHDPSMSAVIYWRRELPPLSEQIEGEHEIEAESPHIHFDVGRRETMWGISYGPLMAEAERRMIQEVLRMGGSCAHVLEEVVTAKIDDASSIFWLRGRFRYVMYRHPTA